MYPFKIKKLEEGGYRFELGPIKMLVDDFTVNGEQHILTHPNKAIAYFNTGDNIYGISNEKMHFDTVEAFYESIKNQYLTFGNSGSRNNNNGSYRQTA